MLLERIVERREGGSRFHREGPMHTKDLDWAIVVLTRGTKRSSRSEDLRGRFDMAERGRRIWWQRYFGARPSWDL